jgi:hypothetical protein
MGVSKDARALNPSSSALTIAAYTASYTLLVMWLASARNQAGTVKFCRPARN